MLSALHGRWFLRIRVLSAALLLVVLPGAVPAADWPLWGCDARRSWVTTEELAAELHLQWVCQYPELEPAWLDEPRMPFDRCYEPVVQGKTLFVNSPRSDSVFALDTETGETRWRFHADGPVRMAPALARGKVYFASDDGYLYCLREEDGAPMWRFQGAPADHLVLGNKRLISAWPARGAPVVDDGKVYFSAGIWPFMGVFLYRLDAETGSVLWENSGTGAMYINQPHNSPAFAGVAPQGYLTLSGDRLLVPGGRSVPACFDRNTGEPLYYHLAANGKRGHFRVAANSKYFINCGHAFDLATGNALVGLGDPENSNPYISDPTPDTPATVLTEDTAYGARRGVVSAHDLTKGHFEPYTDKDGKPQQRFVIPRLWDLTAQAERVWLKAGSRLYAGGPKSVLAIKLPDPGSKPSIAWQAEIEGTPGTMIAADGKLFVVTLEGRLYCFGPRSGEAKLLPPEQAPPPPEDQWTARVRSLVAEQKVGEGYCLVLGVGTGRLAEELARQTELHVIAVDPDRAKIEALRERLDAAGLYGARVAAQVGDPLSLRLPPYFAGLIVSEDLRAAGFEGGRAFVQRLFHPLRPYGGKACLSVPADRQGDFAAWVSQAGLERAEVTRAGDYAVLTRVGALPGSADWTHHYADAANTCVSKDQAARPPLGLLWFGGSSNMTILPRHGHGPSEEVIDGRLFIEGPDTLRAMDVYTGRLLWQVELAGLGSYYNNTSHQPGANALGSNYVASSEALYVAYGRSCLLLDPATGRKLREFTLPAPPGSNEPPLWGHLAVYEDLLIAGASPVIFEGQGKPGGAENWDATSSKTLVAMNRHTGEVLWTQDSRFCFRHSAIAVGGGKLFCVDRLPDEIVARMSRRGETPEGTPRLLCLDVRTGEVRWQTDTDVFGTWLGYSEEHDALLQAGRPSRDMLPDERGDRMIVYRGAGGSVLWDKPHQYRGPCLLHGDTIITQTISLNELGGAFSLLTGERLTRANPLTGLAEPWLFGRNYGCNTVIASENLLTFRSAAAGYYDLTSDGGTGNLGGFKSGCTSNLIVANGVLNAPDYTRTCTCSYQNQTSLAFVHMREAEMWTFNTYGVGDEPVRRVGINLGAPGDRAAPDGTLWLDYPDVGGPSPDVAVSVAPGSTRWFRKHSSRLQGEGLTWVAASGARGLTSLSVTLDKKAQQARPYTVSLYFSEPDDLGPGERVFNVALQGRTVLEGLDIAKETGGPNRVLVRTFQGVAVKGNLTVSLTPAPSSRIAEPVLCGVAVAAEQG